MTAIILPDRSVDYQTKVNLRDLTVWHVGQGNDIYNAVLSRIQQFRVLEMRALDVQVLLRNETLEFVEPKRPLLIVFNGNWISNHVNDAKIYNFLREAARQKANLVALGGATSNFFEVLNKAGVNDLPVDDKTGIARNPAYFNPPLVVSK